jgi:hypothetical protein
LRLPLWGSYTKTYNGISHVADLKRGMRFDLSVFPGHYRREVMVPNVNWEGGFHPWEAAPGLWQAEVDESYDCFEHFLIESGRGAGWHQFSALSSPVLAWFSAYYRPGRLTTGFDTWVHQCEFDPDYSALYAELDLRARPGGDANVLVTLVPDRTYRARWNGNRVSARPAESGTLQIALPRDSGRGRLEVEPA